MPSRSRGERSGDSTCYEKKAALLQSMLDKVDDSGSVITDGKIDELARMYNILGARSDDITSSTYNSDYGSSIDIHSRSSQGNGSMSDSSETVALIKYAENTIGNELLSNCSNNSMDGDFVSFGSSVDESACSYQLAPDIPNSDKKFKGFLSGCERSKVDLSSSPRSKSLKPKRRGSKKSLERAIKYLIEKKKQEASQSETTASTKFSSFNKDLERKVNDLTKLLDEERSTCKRLEELRETLHGKKVKSMANAERAKMLNKVRILEKQLNEEKLLKERKLQELNSYVDDITQEGLMFPPPDSFQAPDQTTISSLRTSLGTCTTYADPTPRNQQQKCVYLSSQCDLHKPTYSAHSVSTASQNTISACNQPSYQEIHCQASNDKRSCMFNDRICFKPRQNNCASINDESRNYHCCQQQYRQPHCETQVHGPSCRIQNDSIGHECEKSSYLDHQHHYDVKLGVRSGSSLSDSCGSNSGCNTATTSRDSLTKVGFEYNERKNYRRPVLKRNHSPSILTRSSHSSSSTVPTRSPRQRRSPRWHPSVRGGEDEYEDSPDTKDYYDDSPIHFKARSQFTEENDYHAAVFQDGMHKYRTKRIPKTPIFDDKYVSDDPQLPPSSASISAPNAFHANSLSNEIENEILNKIADKIIAKKGSAWADSCIRNTNDGKEKQLSDIIQNEKVAAELIVLSAVESLKSGKTIEIVKENLANLLVEYMRGYSERNGRTSSISNKENINIYERGEESRNDHTSLVFSRGDDSNGSVSTRTQGNMRWANMSVTAAATVLQNGGDEKVARAAATSVLKMCQENQGAEDDQTLFLGPTAAKASTAVLKAGGTQKSAAAVSVAILKAVEEKSSTEYLKKVVSDRPTLNNKESYRKEGEIARGLRQRTITDNFSNSTSSAKEVTPKSKNSTRHLNYGEKRDKSISFHAYTSDDGSSVEVAFSRSGGENVDSYLEDLLRAHAKEQKADSTFSRRSRHHDQINNQRPPRPPSSSPALRKRNRTQNTNLRQNDRVGQRNGSSRPRNPLSYVVSSIFKRSRRKRLEDQY